MGLDFYCNIWTAGSELDINNTKAWFILPCINGSGYGDHVMLWAMFIWHTLGISYQLSID